MALGNSKEKIIGVWKKGATQMSRPSGSSLSSSERVHGWSRELGRLFSVELHHRAHELEKSFLGLDAKGGTCRASERLVGILLAPDVEPSAHEVVLVFEVDRVAGRELVAKVAL